MALDAIFEATNADIELANIILAVAIGVLEDGEALVGEHVLFFKTAHCSLEGCHVFIDSIESLVDSVEPFFDCFEAFAVLACHNGEVIQNFIYFFVECVCHGFNITRDKK